MQNWCSSTGIRREPIENLFCSSTTMNRHDPSPNRFTQLKDPSEDPLLIWPVASILPPTIEADLSHVTNLRQQFFEQS